MRVDEDEAEDRAITHTLGTLQRGKGVYVTLPEGDPAEAHPAEASA